jgi:hypothetical protein
MITKKDVPIPWAFLLSREYIPAHAHFGELEKYRPFKEL